jgi:hypothetical protein
VRDEDQVQHYAIAAIQHSGHDRRFVLQNSTDINSYSSRLQLILSSHLLADAVPIGVASTLRKGTLPKPGDLRVSVSNLLDISTSSMSSMSTASSSSPPPSPTLVPSPTPTPPPNNSSENYALPTSGTASVAALHRTMSNSTLSDKLIAILNDSMLRGIFSHHLASSRSDELIQFWHDVNGYRRRGAQLQWKRGRAREIHDTYVAAHSRRTINLNASTVATIDERLASMESCSAVDVETLFDGAMNETYDLLLTDALPKFLQSHTYATLRAKLEMPPNASPSSASLSSPSLLSGSQQARASPTAMLKKLMKF